MRKSRKLLLIWLLVFMGLGLLMESLRSAIGTQSQYENWTNLMLGLAFSMVIFAWCRAESSERGVEGSRGLRVWAAMFPPVGLPLYLIRTRGLKSAVVTSAKAVGCFVGFCAAFAITEALLHVAKA
jgi:hypothetical protein